VQWPGALLIGAVSNVDNLGVGVALGVRGRRLGAIANLIVAGITMAATAASVTCGHLLSKIIPSAVTGWLGPLIIIAIGIATACTCAQTRPPPDFDRVVSRREAITFGVALSVNNLGTGVGAGVLGIHAFAATVSAGLLSFVCVGGGCHFGRVLGRLVLRRYAPLVAGMLLLAVGAAMLPGVR
jgi:putative Mn2+ efflux pump MntP